MQVPTKFIAYIQEKNLVNYLVLFWWDQWRKKKRYIYLLMYYQYSHSYFKGI